MYAYVYDVATLVDYANHLLVGISHWYAHQSAKLAYAEVDMHYEVAWFHLLKFLHRECHLARPCRVTAQTVLVETVKYLVVGEETGS